MLSSDSPLRRRLVLIVAALGVLVPYGYAVTQAWRDADRGAAIAADERDGITYLKPLTALIDATVEAQSAAVAGSPFDSGKLRTAQARVDEVDKRLGATLRTTLDWTRLSGLVDAALANPVSGAAAFRTFTAITDQELRLVTVLGEESQLILDPQLDSYYLMDSTVARLPRLVVNAGLIKDSVSAQIGGRSLETLQVQLRADAQSVNDALRTASTRTDNPSVSAALVPVLGPFNSVIGQIAPAVSEVGVTNPALNQDKGPVVKATTDLRAAAMSLDQAALGQLDVLIAERGDGFRRERLIVVGSVLLGALIAVGALVLARRRTAGRGRPRTADAESGVQAVRDPQSRDALADIFPGSGRTPSRQVDALARTVPAPWETKP